MKNMISKKIRNTLVATLAIALVGGLTACNSGSNGEKDNKVAITYNTPEQWANWGGVLKSFSKKTGIKAPNDNKNSSQVITALTAEKANPVADVVYLGITFGMKAKSLGLVQGYKPPHFDEIPASLKDKDGKWMTVHYGAVAFLVNTQALGNVPVPKSWKDLLKPQYKGKVGFLDPSSAAIGYSVATAANSAMGGTLDNFKPGMDYLKKLVENGAVMPKQTATAKVLKGEIPILIDADFNGYQMKYDDKAPIQVVIPKEGSIKIPYVVSLVKNGPDEKSGKALMDYLLSDEGQKKFAEGYVRPVITSAMTAAIKAKFLPDSDYERVKDVDYAKMEEKQNLFIDLWKESNISK